MSRSIHHKANRRGSGVRSSPHIAALMHRKQLRHVEDLLQIAALTRLNTPECPKRPGYLPPQRAGWLSSPWQQSQTSSHTAECMDQNTIRSDTYAADLPLHWRKQRDWRGQNNVTNRKKSAQDSEVTVKDGDGGKGVPECCQHEGRCPGSRRRWCALGRVHRYWSCMQCVTALTTPPPSELSAYYRGMEDISCPRSTINASIIISTVCSVDQMTRTVFGPGGRDKILSTRSDSNCTVLLCCFVSVLVSRVQWFTRLWCTAAGDKICL